MELTLPETIKQTPVCETDGRSSNKVFPRSLWNMKVHDRIDKRHFMESTLRKIKLSQHEKIL